MNLHENEEEFRVAVIGASEKYNLDLHIVEKDYWITMLLKKMSEFEYSKYAVFKGGTSLSKGFGIIKRFSEDVDVALSSNGVSETGIHKKSGEAIHRFIKKLKVSDFQDIKEEKESEKQRYKRV